MGDDDFGWLNIERLRDDGVDTSAIAVSPGSFERLQAVARAGDNVFAELMETVKVAASAWS